VRREALLRGGSFNKGKAKGTFKGHLQGTPRLPRRVAIVLGSLVNVFCVVHFALRPSIYIYSKLVFPLEGFSKVMLTKNMCQFHACLEVLEQHLEL